MGTRKRRIKFNFGCFSLASLFQMITFWHFFYKLWRHYYQREYNVNSKINKRKSSNCTHQNSDRMIYIVRWHSLKLIGGYFNFSLFFILAFVHFLPVCTLIRINNWQKVKIITKSTKTLKNKNEEKGKTTILNLMGILKWAEAARRRRRAELCFFRAKHWGWSCCKNMMLLTEDSSHLFHGSFYERRRRWESTCISDCIPCCRILKWNIST